ncbi:MAG: class I SAM-dependent methyltransferase [Caulobacterales bacterium]|nr:class I SAM-dependent methyltransferase [Caulobacterales bacterium]
MSGSIGLTPELVSYVRAANGPEHPVMARCREETALGFPRLVNMMISPEQATFLQFLVRVMNARDALEIGVFTGYSALAVAMAMRERHGGEARLVACDLNQAHMTRAASYFQAAEVDDVVEPRVGPAATSLDHLIDSGEEGGFDFAFIDADKTGYAGYFEQVLTLLRPGGVMAFDNMLWEGDVADPAKRDADTAALRKLADRAKDDPRVDVSMTNIGDGVLFCAKR